MGVRPHKKKAIPGDRYAAALVAWRLGLGLSQTAAAERLGVSRPTIERWETSGWHMPVRAWDIILTGLAELRNQPEV